jgi:hypothetical protein
MQHHSCASRTTLASKVLLFCTLSHTIPVFLA